MGKNDADSVPPGTPIRKVSSLWINDTAGHPSVTVTMMLVAFIVTTGAYVLSIFSKIGPIEIRSFDVGACAAYMGSVMALYGGRRWTDARAGITQMRESMQQIAAPPLQPYGQQYYYQSPMGYPPGYTPPSVPPDITGGGNVGGGQVGNVG